MIDSRRAGSDGGAPPAYSEGMRSGERLPDRTAGDARIARATAGDADAIESLLAGSGLPLAGLDAALGTAIVARAGGTIVGCAAIEPHGAAALLRSVCVAAEWRDRGLGRRLVEAGIELARSGGADELYLLTETAAAWFPRFGFEPVERAAVPAPLAASAEFAGACPITASVLRRRL